MAEKTVFQLQKKMGVAKIMARFMRHFVPSTPLNLKSWIRPCNVGLLFLGKWITPTVTGDRPPPISGFTLTSVTNNTAILFGGFSIKEASSNVYIINFTKASVVSVLIRLSIILVILLKISWAPGYKYYYLELYNVI